MVKSYTDVSQSMILKKILSEDSADMEYMFLKKDGSKVSNVPFVKDGFEEPECCYIFIPCWSLAALVEILPNNFGRYDKTLGWWDGSYHCTYIDDETECKYDALANNPVDACYEMILYLNEQNLL